MDKDDLRTLCDGAGLNIAERARELAKRLNEQGFGGLDMPDVSPECEEEWGPDYAILDGVYFDDFCLPTEALDYFAWPQLEYDFAMMLKEYFTNEGEVTTLVRPHEGTRDEDCPDGIVVHFYRSSQEIEVYRVRNGKCVPHGPLEEE